MWCPGKLYLLLPILIAFLNGCNNCGEDCFYSPDPFDFRIIDRISGEDLLFSELAVYHHDSIRLFYFRGDEETDLPLRKIYSVYEYNFFRNQTVPYLSSLENIKDFYLQLNHLETDTLLIDVREINLNCCTVFEYAESYFNGSSMRKNLNDPTVFLLEK